MNKIWDYISDYCGKEGGYIENLFFCRIDGCDTVASASLLEYFQELTRESIRCRVWRDKVGKWLGQKVFLLPENIRDSFDSLCCALNRLVVPLARFLQNSEQWSNELKEDRHLEYHNMRQYVMSSAELVKRTVPDKLCFYSLCKMNVAAISCDDHRNWNKHRDTHNFLLRTCILTVCKVSVDNFSLYFVGREKDCVSLSHSIHRFPDFMWGLEV